MPSHSGKKGQHTPHSPIGDVRDAKSLYHDLQRFLAWLAERQYLPKTIVNRRRAAVSVHRLAERRGIRRRRQ
jgi:hypothetical protein